MIEQGSTSAKLKSTPAVIGRADRLRPRRGAWRLIGIAALLGASSVGAQVPPAPCPAELPCRLSVNLPEGDVQSVQITVNGNTAVFVQQGSDNVDRLFSVPVRGGEFPVPLTAPVVTGSVSTVRISPDGKRIVYLGVTGSGGQRALFSVPVTGPAAANVRLADSIAGSPLITPDSRKVVYATAARDRLRAVPIEGPRQAGVRLTGPFESGAVVGEFASSANSRSLVYLAGAQLFRVPLTLSPSPTPPTVRLSDPASGGVDDFTLAPNNGRVVYLNVAGAARELFSVTLGGAGRVKINTPLPPGWVVRPPDDESVPARTDSSGTRVFYEIQEAASPGQPQKELHSVPITAPGTESVRLDNSSAPDARIAHYKISDAREEVVYTTFDSNNRFNLLAVPVEGPASASRGLFFPSSVDSLVTLSPNQRVAIWEVSQSLFAIPLANPGGIVQLDGSEDPIAPYLVNASHTFVVYRAETGLTGDGLFSAPLAGNGPSVNLVESLNQPILDEIVLTSQGDRVVYTVQEGINGSKELFVSTVDPSSAASTAPEP